MGLEKLYENPVLVWIRPYLKKAICFRKNGRTEGTYGSTTQSVKAVYGENQLGLLYVGLGEKGTFGSLSIQRAARLL